MACSSDHRSNGKSGNPEPRLKSLETDPFSRSRGQGDFSNEPCDHVHRPRCDLRRLSLHTLSQTVPQSAQTYVLTATHRVFALLATPDTSPQRNLSPSPNFLLWCLHGDSALPNRMNTARPSCSLVYKHGLFHPKSCVFRSCEPRNKNCVVLCKVCVSQFSSNTLKSTTA